MPGWAVGFSVLGTFVSSISFVGNPGKAYTDNWAPRFGFTFTPTDDGRLLIRGGAGMFYDKLVLAFPAVSAVTSGTAIQLAVPIVVCSMV